jgi:3'-phosphoadenosine 5'-phosphosulfate sulfotransferase (PAPS reductase)/FAD synthetase
MREIKEEIYKNLLGCDPQNTIIAWSGGPYSSLIWWVAYHDLNLKFPLIFIDDHSLSPALYAFIEETRRKYNLNVEIIQVEPGKLFDKLKELADNKKVLIGKKLEFGICPLPQTPQTWNYLKLIGVKFFSTKKGLLGI